MVQEIHAAVRQYQADPVVRVIVLGSALERYFSTGADIAFFKDMSKAKVVDWTDLAHELVRTLRHSEKPFAGGDPRHCGGRRTGDDPALRPALRRHRRQAGPAGGQHQLYPPIDATQALARLIGRPRAIRLFCDGKMISAQEAHHIGLVDTLVAPNELRGVVQAYGETLAAKPPEALAAIRRAVTLGGGMSFDNGLAYEREHIIHLAGTDNFREGLAAFTE
ncbi:MAG: enoyl-CoA hydratase/isomerase family protein [Alphaproteobacteria bacterium]